MTEKMKFFLNSNPGYIVIPRALAEHLIHEISIDDATTLYGYLLLSANYAQSQTPTGIVRRGELNATITQIAREMEQDYGRIRRLMKELEIEELVTYHSENGHRHIFLPYYEEHCGRKVRAAEQSLATKTAAENLTDKTFGYFWEFYHQIIPVPQLDLARARKIYGKLSLKERETAIRNVEVYYASLINEKHAKWAVNYLKDKSFILPQTEP